jgi:poly(hydroxyalkanoate) depolymerase family esterase
MLMIKTLFVALAVLLGPSGALAADSSLPGQWLSGHLARDDAREFKLYVPAAAQRSRPVPLVVMLHGCTQTPASFADSTRMNALAENGVFLVLYPEQKPSANPARCWNWFVPANQARGSGEPAQIVAMVEQVAREHAVDRTRVYVAGLSAGASMSAILAACYPDVFAAAALHGGTMYKAASSFPAAQKVMLTAKGPDPDALGAEAWACGGRQRTMTPVMVWQGEGDNVVNRRNAEHVVRQFAKLNDWADDGRANGSLPQKPSKDGGQVAGGYGYAVTRYEYRGRPLIEYYQVATMGHAWSGGKDGVRFSDPKGPNASALMWEFFQRHSR